MNTNTKYFGTIDYEEKDMLHIPEGLFGFEQHKDYLLIHFNDDDDSLLCLQSILEESLAFILVNPFYNRPDYQPRLSKEDMGALALSDDSSVSFYTLCVIHDKLEDSTVNLRCPIAINPVTRQARQIVLEDARYTFKHALNPAMMQKEGKSC